MEFGSLVLVVNGDVVAGTVQAPPETYTIRSVGDGVHVIRKVDLSTLPPEAEPVAAPVPATSELAPAVSAARDPPVIPMSIADPPQARRDDGSVIDVLVVFTAAAKWYAGGAAEIAALIDLSVAETNRAYAASKVIQRIRLAHKREIIHEERGGLVDIDRLAGLHDGFLDDLHTLRDDYKADLVALITAPLRGLCGIAAAIGPETPDTGFSITAANCLSPNYTFAHELGHNMGLRHDVYVDDSVTPFPDNHGYVNQQAFIEGAPKSARWRTIMAYNRQCDREGRFYCIRLPRFSNPEQSRNGDPLGVADVSNARRVLDETRTTMARFRARASARLSPDPTAVSYKDDGVWRRFTVRATEPIRVVANPTGTPRRVEMTHNPDARNLCPPEQDDTFDMNDGQTVYLAGCSTGAGIVTLVRAADDTPIRSYVLPIVNAGGSSASLTPDPAAESYGNDGAWRRFTVRATDPIRVVANPPGTLRRVEITENRAGNYCPPEQDDTFVMNNRNTVYLAGCVPGAGTVHLVRDVDGATLRTYTLPIRAVPNPCVETLGNLSRTVTRAGSWSPECTSAASRQNVRIDGLEFTARIVDLHLPVDTALRSSDVGGPRRHFAVQRLEVADAAPVQALTRHRTQFILGDVQPAPVLRRVAELEATNQFPSPGRLEHLVEGAGRVRVEVVAHQGDLRAVGVAALQQVGDLHRPVRLRPPGPRRRPPPTRQRLAEQEDRGRAGPFVLVVDAAGPRQRGGHRRARFLDQLHRLLIHAHDRASRVVRLRIGVQDLLHVRHELGVGLRRDHPVLDFPPGHPVFFSVRRMVSWLTDSTTSSSTTRRASSRNDQLA